MQKKYVDHELDKKADKFIPTLAPGVDLNDYVVTGVYSQDVNVHAASGKNYPAPLGGLLEVFGPTGNMNYQRYTCYKSGDVYHRGSYAGSWSPWKQLLQKSV